MTIVKSNAITAAPPLPVPPLISIDTKMDQKSTTLPGKIGKMERRSSILKEKRRKKSIHLIKTTSNTLESKVSNMMLSSQKEIEMNKGDSDPPTETPPIPNPNSSKKYFNDKEQSNIYRSHCRHPHHFFPLNQNFTVLWRNTCNRK